MLLFLGNTSHLAISKVVVLVVLAMYQWNWAACRQPRPQPGQARQGAAKNSHIIMKECALSAKNLAILSVIVLPGSQKTAVRGNE